MIPAMPPRRPAPNRRPGRAGATLLLAAIGAAGCAGRQPPATTIDLPLPAAEVAPPATAAEQPPEAPPPDARPAPAAPEAAPADAPAAAPEEDARPAPAETAQPAPEATSTPGAAGEPAAAKRPRLRDLCRQPEPEDQPFLDESRRVLEQTFCGATLWFDGLFGGEPDVANAREVSGRVELTTLYTEFEELDYGARLRLNYDLPTLERRLRLFLGRDDEDEFVQDRREGFAIRSSVFGLETEEQWLAGLGYSPPGPWFRRFDVRVGGRVKSAPEVFAQTRYRYNRFVGDHTVWRLRETVFWENRDGWGTTANVDLDRVLRRDLLVRWGGFATYSETTEGIAWRSATLLYKNLRASRAGAAEVFVRGSTGAEVKMREYGTRFIYRQPIGKPYLFGEIIVGYTWPRVERHEPREGSAMLGFGLEFLFGRDPF